MKIIILGAGQVGGSLAEHLASESNDITVIDTDEARLRELQSIGPTAEHEAMPMPLCWLMPAFILWNWSNSLFSNLR